MMNVLLVGIGGCIGVLTRYAITSFVIRIAPLSGFPWGTFIVNILGCFIIGFISGLDISKHFLSTPMKLFMFTGILGGFTTFSTFGLETFVLFENKQLFLALLNILSQVTLGLLLLVCGYRIGSWI